ncbi:MAG TPA: maleylpyruvate isomerase family mycothiol-dependent enzyme [Kineosporiaceae bacterium]|nr:maleylpyruvate isomerase family mycothiol-dependent enzyme [Kineosporiaceae bacterium]
MTDPKTSSTQTLTRLADQLESLPPEGWDVPSLCDGWQVRHVVAHVTMPARYTPERFGAEMAAARGDFERASSTIAARDAMRPVAEHLADLRSPVLHAWEAPGGGAAGALAHAVIHSLDVTLPLGLPDAAPADAVLAVLTQLTDAQGAMFGVELDGVRLEATDADLTWGTGETVRATGGELVALVSGRTLPDGRSLPRARAAVSG